MAVVARTYARALFDAAKEHGRLAQVRDELNRFAEAVGEVPELEALILNPELDTRAKIDALDALLEGADELLRNFVRLVTEKGRAPMLEEISRELDELVAADERILNVELTTAYELSEEEAAGIVARIQEASGRIVEATRRVDPSLIGGLILQAGSLRVDASVRGRLDRLRHQLATGS
jgi:F-type H+-transporting ATPase subunit delta